MTRKQAETFIAEWQPLLAPEWEVTVEEGPSPGVAADEHLACTRTQGAGEYLLATIYLHRTADGSLSPEDSRQTILHELLHLTLDDLEHAAKAPTESLGTEARELMTQLINRYIERTVDRLATAFAACTD